MVTYTPLSNYVSVPALTCMLQEAIVLTNSSNAATMGSIITPFSQSLFNGGTMNVMEITDTLTGLTMTMSPSLGCDKFYILTFSTASKNAGIAGKNGSGGGVAAGNRGNGASGMAKARGAIDGLNGIVPQGYGSPCNGNPAINCHPIGNGSRSWCNTEEGCGFSTFASPYHRRPRG